MGSCIMQSMVEVTSCQGSTSLATLLAACWWISPAAELAALLWLISHHRHDYAHKMARNTMLHHCHLTVTLLTFQGAENNLQVS